LPVHDAVAVQQKHEKWAVVTMLEAWSRVAASGGAACVSGWELQLPTDGRPLPVPQSNAYSHSFERESKTILTRAFTKYP
jgi:hypothetical protein